MMPTMNTPSGLLAPVTPAGVRAGTSSAAGRRGPRTTVIVVTLNRPDCVRQCLGCLLRQDPRPEQVIVVDASADDRTRRAVGEFDGVEYLRNDQGAGKMTTSRNIGLGRARGEIVAFVDDDAFAHDGWLAALVGPYADPAVGAVGGRAVNGQPGEAGAAADRVGRLWPDGSVTGHFAADPGRVLRVDHVIGCNMSYRRSVLQTLGGFRDDYPGVSGIREDTDMCLRVGRLGHHLLFHPAAVVTHVGAPQVRGRRFDARYAYFHARNHAMLMGRNFGPLSARACRSGVREVREMAAEAGKRFAVAAGHLVARAAGLAVGAAVGAARYARERGDPVRRPPVEVGRSQGDAACPP